MGLTMRNSQSIAEFKSPDFTADSADAKRNLDAALKNMREVHPVEKELEKPRALSLKGRIREVLGNFRGAANEYAATGSYLEAANNYLKAGDYRGAIKSFDQHLESKNIDSPRTASEAKIFMQRGHAKFKAGRINDALQDFGKAVAVA